MEYIQDQNQKISIKRVGEDPVLGVHQKGGVYWLSFPQLDARQEFLHGFSTRLGGVSKEHLYSMNLSFSRGDSEENVRENFRRMGAAIGFEPEKMVFSHQTHTTNIRKVTREDCGKGFSRERDYQDIDGLITNEPGVVLTTFYADCEKSDWLVSFRMERHRREDQPGNDSLYAGIIWQPAGRPAGCSRSIYLPGLL